MIVSATIQQLESYAPLTALLAYHPKTDKAHAIYANHAPQESATPLLVVSAASDEVTYELSGDTGLTESTLDIDIQTDGTQAYAKLEAVKTEVRKALSTVGADWSGVYVQDVKLSGLRDEDYVLPAKERLPLHVGGWQASIFWEFPLS